MDRKLTCLPICPGKIQPVQVNKEKTDDMRDRKLVFLKGLADRLIFWQRKYRFFDRFKFPDI
jgi:hypothetical protein